MKKRICGSCGAREMIRFENETFVIDRQGHKIAVADLSGLRCGACGEVLFDAEAARRYAAASDALVHAARREERAELKRTRQRLGLTQKQAAFLTGGGPNAFSRYETGKAPPMAAVVNLFRLLGKHPELLEELPAIPGRQRRTTAVAATAATAERSAAKAKPPAAPATRAGKKPSAERRISVE